MANPLIPKKNNSPVKMVDLPHSAGILDDFAVRKNVATKEGTIEQVPTENNHIVNKSYADSLVSNSANWDTAYTHSQDNTQAHSDYMLNTGDTATGNYNFDSGTLFVDSVNHRVGVGTATPDKKLTIYQNLNADNEIYVQNGYAGKGSYITTRANGTYSAINCIGTGATWKMGLFGDTSFKVVSYDGTTRNPLKINLTTPTNTLFLGSTGNVGINDASPAEKLDVAGNINLTGVLKIDDVQVLKEQQAHIEDLNAAYAEADLDTAAEVKDAINATNAKINAILAMLEAHGLVASS